MDRKYFEDWIQGYIKAWTSNKAEDIAALFSVEAEYYTLPFRDAYEGRQAIVDFWIKRDDQPDDWQLEYDWLAVEGDTGVLRGLSTYDKSVYSNIWLIKLNEVGRCYEFREWWVKKG